MAPLAAAARTAWMPHLPMPRSTSSILASSGVSSAGCGGHWVPSRGLTVHRAFDVTHAVNARRDFNAGRDSNRTCKAVGALALLVATSRLSRRKLSGLAGNELRHRTSIRAHGGEVRTAPVPVIVLSGFLGTGKTTLLRHWLEHSDSRIGVVVNDVAAVNIDAKLIERQSQGAQGRVQTIQLENGCACCSLGDELLVTIYDLLALQREGEEPFSHIIVELSGVAEPKRVRENFRQAMRSRSEVVEGFELSKVVTVIDASSFCYDYMEYSRMTERPELMDGSSSDGADLKVVELLVEQAEAADVVVLNKTDLASADNLEATKAVVSALNRDARICETSFGRLSLAEVLGRPERPPLAAAVSTAFGGEDHGHGNDDEHGHSQECEDPECDDHAHGHGHGPPQGHGHASSSATTAEERFGIRSFTYVAQRPFHSERLAEVLKAWPVSKRDDLCQLLEDLGAEFGDKAAEMSPLARVIRSKGFCWLDTFPSTRMYWSHAGKSLALEHDGPWWGSMTDYQLKVMESMAPGDYERCKRESWTEEWGDRRQELVFIGQRLDESGIRANLDGCLLRDDELDAYAEKQQTDAEEISRGWPMA